MKMCTPHHHLLDPATVPSICELTTRPRAFFDRLRSGRPKTTFFPGGSDPKRFVPKSRKKIVQRCFFGPF